MELTKNDTEGMRAYNESKRIRQSIPIGGYWAEDIKNSTVDATIDRVVVLSRPEPYWSIKSRIKLAWDILRYKADAVYWYKQ